MTRPILTAGVVLLGSHGLARADEEFEHVAVHFEQNVTDRDAEVVLEATAGNIGLATLKIVAPDGRTLVDFKAPNSKLGIRHFTFESPEPANDGSVQADFPQGKYSFSGRTVTGVEFHSTATLSHILPDAGSFVRPRPDEEDVPVKGLTVEWKPVKTPAAWILTIEQEDTGIELSAKLPGNMTQFAVPDGFLIPGMEHKVAIGTLSQEGNSSFVETEYTTAGEK